MVNNMVARSKKNGRDIEYDEDVEIWIYSDTKEPVVKTEIIIQEIGGKMDRFIIQIKNEGIKSEITILGKFNVINEVVQILKSLEPLNKLEPELKETTEEKTPEEKSKELESYPKHPTDPIEKAKIIAEEKYQEHNKNDPAGEMETRLPETQYWDMVRTLLNGNNCVWKLNGCEIKVKGTEEVAKYVASKVLFNERFPNVLIQSKFGVVIPDGTDGEIPFDEYFHGKDKPSEVIHHGMWKSYINAIHNGNLITCKKETYEKGLREHLQEYAGKCIDNGDHVRAQIALEEVKRLDELFRK